MRTNVTLIASAIFLTFTLGVAYAADTDAPTANQPVTGAAVGTRVPKLKAIRFPCRIRRLAAQLIKAPIQAQPRQPRKARASRLSRITAPPASSLKRRKPRTVSARASSSLSRRRDHHSP